jgi:hypothetical protein
VRFLSERGGARKFATGGKALQKPRQHHDHEGSSRRRWRGCPAAARAVSRHSSPAPVPELCLRDRRQRPRRVEKEEVAVGERDILAQKNTAPRSSTTSSSPGRPSGFVRSLVDVRELGLPPHERVRHLKRNRNGLCTPSTYRRISDPRRPALTLRLYRKTSAKKPWALQLSAVLRSSVAWINA